MAAFIRVDSTAEASASGIGRERPLEVAEVHAAHADLVWRSLARLGVRNDDLPDMLQEVFLVVHRRGGSYDGSSKLTSWLFGICLRVAAGYRRRAHRRHERPLQSAAEPVAAAELGPEQALAQKQARARLAQVLDGMPLDKRAIFVMFEVDAMSCAEIAGTLEIPIGTVHSRLSAAREAFEASLRRENARGGRRP